MVAADDLLMTPLSEQIQEQDRVEKGFGSAFLNQITFKLEHIVLKMAF